MHATQTPQLTTQACSRCIDTLASSRPSHIRPPTIRPPTLGLSHSPLPQLESVHYRVALPPSMNGIKVVLVPINGDSDLFISFDHAHPTKLDASFVEESYGVKQFTLPRSSPHFCPAAAPARVRRTLGYRSGGGGGGGGSSRRLDGSAPAAAAAAAAAPAGACVLYLTVSGFEEGDYKLAVYNYTAEPGSSTTSAAWSCSEGCDERNLGNTRCDLACNVSACLWDQGDCGYVGEFASAAICSTGCATEWQGDGYCDEACFNTACAWDEGDCISADAGCSDGCLPSWIDDEECDDLCNNEACGWDGSDCYHGIDDCYTEKNGSDYRGNVASTRSGHACQPWSSQEPHPHMFTHLAYPHGGLGGHSYCRNPGGVQAGPWCHTTDPNVPMELCAVPAAQPSCSRLSAGSSDATQRYHTMCPVDCASTLGNGVCETRCNISSCAYDEGDCGVGVDLLTILADQGYVLPGGGSQLSTYVLIGVGVLIGVLIGLLVLRMTLIKIKNDERKRRGYTTEEMRGVDGGFEEGDDE